jgi:hypothetical protein
MVGRGGDVSSMFHQHIETCNIVSKQYFIVSKQVRGELLGRKCLDSQSLGPACEYVVVCVFMCLGVGVYVRVFVCAFVRP